ncbi:hypothetical protein FJZ27_00025 [Candidatus Peribacteria bacterium]|nr:hypothetical protein [Candidatus Peribacteria bacterium]
MQALLLLAGRSRRFWPLNEKTLFPICGKTLLEHQIDRLRAAGLKHITLVGGAHNLTEAKHLTGLTGVLQKDLDLGMRGALLVALPKIRADEPVLIVSGNDVVDSEAYALVMQKAKKGDGAVLAKKMKAYFPGGYLTMKGARISGIVEKPKPGSEPSKLVTIVAHVHNDPRSLLASLKHVRPKRDDGYELALAELFATKRYAAAPYEGVWRAVKYPWHMVPLLETLLLGIERPFVGENVSIHPSAVVDGNVVLGDGVRILPHATIVGPCVIGSGTIVGNNALVRASSIGNNCVIGYGTEVKGSVLGHDVWTHMTYLGESVVGNNVSFGGGCITGNLRLDEGMISSAFDGDRIDTGLTKLGCIVGDGCRLGIHVSLQPGVNIGAGSFVSSAVVVGTDVPDGSFVTMKGGEMHVRKNRTTTNAASKRSNFRSAIST